MAISSFNFPNFGNRRPLYGTRSQNQTQRQDNQSGQHPQRPALNTQNPGGNFGGFNVVNGQGTQVQQGNQNYDLREAEVARILGISVEQFHQLPENQKRQMVQEYNQSHPDNPIPEKRP